MEEMEDMTGWALAELDHLVEAALGELASHEGGHRAAVDPYRPPDEEDAPWPEDPAVSEIVAAADRLREVTRVQRLEAPALATRLERHPETRARLLIDNQARFQTWGLCEELLDRCQKAIFESKPERAVRIARLATAVAERLDEEIYGGGLAPDLRARSWGALGNALRCASQFEAAAAAFRMADDLLDEGSGDPLERANLLSLRGSLAFWAGDLEGALQILDHAETIYRELDEDDLRGKILIQKAHAAGYLAPAQGVRFASAAQRVIDSEADPRLFLNARHAHIYWLVESGQPERARMLLDASRGLYRRFDDSWFRFRVAGVEAQLLFAEGRIEEAEAALEVLLTEYTERDLHLDILITVLEIAACRLARGDAAGAAEIAAAMAPQLLDCGAHEHAREAWGLFRHALSVERASQELIREVKTYLRLAWKNPRLRFSTRLTSGPASI